MPYAGTDSRLMVVNAPFTCAGDDTRFIVVDALLAQVLAVSTALEVRLMRGLTGCALSWRRMLG